MKAEIVKKRKSGLVLINLVKAKPIIFGSVDREKKRWEAPILEITRSYMATQDHTSPQKIIQGHIRLI